LVLEWSSVLRALSYGAHMSEHREPQREKHHEGMSQDEARHEEDAKHHPYEARKSESEEE